MVSFKCAKCNLGTPRSVTLTSETRRFLNSSFYLSTLMRHHMALHWFTGRCLDTVSFYQESKNYALYQGIWIWH